MNSHLTLGARFVGITIFTLMLVGCATSQTVNVADSAATDNPAGSAEAETKRKEPDQGDEEREAHPGAGHVILMYLPNRLFDLTDIVRLNARVGPGFGVGARATTLLDAFLGSYVSLYVGLPGPRLEREVIKPVGLASHSGIEISLAEAKTAGGKGPGYSSTEFGADVHLLLVGVDLGIDPLEVLDFVTGFLMIEIRKDDL